MRYSVCYTGFSARNLAHTAVRALTLRAQTFREERLFCAVSVQIFCVYICKYTADILIAVVDYISRTPSDFQRDISSVEHDEI